MSDTPTAAPIEATALTKTYRLGFFLSRRVKALQGLDLRIENGQVFGLLGPNGAGKSTTIKILMNLVQPSSGTARLFGLPPSDPHARRLVGFLPENPAPYEYLTGGEFVRLAGRLGGLSGQALDQRVKKVIGDVGMARAENLPIRRYSKGMIQRIGLAQALVNQPKLLILDEPTSGLDPVGRRQMRDLILSERERGTTILFCTHIIPDAEALCDHLAVLVAGRRVREGSVRELLTSQASSVELTVEGVTLDELKGWGESLESTQVLGSRLLIKASDASVQRLLPRIIQSKGKLIHLQAAKHSLEDLFLRALEEAKGPTVGGEFE